MKKLCVESAFLFDYSLPIFIASFKSTPFEKATSARIHLRKETVRDFAVRVFSESFVTRFYSKLI